MKKVLDFLIKFIYINIDNRTVFFYLVLIFIGAVFSENCDSTVLLSRKILPFYFKESQVEKLCKCGCGQVVRIKYYHKWAGIPNYIYHHHNRINPSRFVEKYCKCGCGELLKHPEKGCEYIQWHHIRGVHLTKETKQKMSIAKTGKNHPMYNKHHSEETKQKMSKAKKGKNNYKKFPSKESRRKMSETRLRKIASGEIKLPYKWFDTKPELAIEEQLKLNNFSYEKQKYIKNVGIVDFFLSDYNVILECDGDYWHNKEGVQQKDADRDFKAILYHNYRTIRFWQYEINESSENCMVKLRKFIKYI